MGSFRRCDIRHHAAGRLHRDQRIAVDIRIGGDDEILGALDEVCDRAIEGEGPRRQNSRPEQAETSKRRGATCQFH
jgi:hypothetical protein